MARSKRRSFIGWSAACALFVVACDEATLVGFDAGPDAGLDGGSDGGMCPAGRRYCEGSTWVECDADGRTKTVVERCAEACDGALGCVHCVPTTGRCDGTVSARCAFDGSRYDVVRDCAASGSACTPSGFCDDACGDAERESTSLGCRFVAATLLTTRHTTFGTAEPFTEPFVVALANPSPDTATILVKRGDRMVASASVRPGGQLELELPWVAETALPFDTFNELPRSVFAPEAAYLITANVPVTAVQLAPLSTRGLVASSGASLLLPAHLLSGAHVAATYLPTAGANSSVGPHGVPPVLALTPAGSSSVTVTVDATAPLLGTERWDSVEAGGRLTFTLEPGDVAQLVPPKPPPCERFAPNASLSVRGLFCRWPHLDPTGSAIEADGPLAVFGGHIWAHVPFDYPDGDHLEEQLPPVATWGSEHAIVPLIGTATVFVPGRPGEFQDPEPNPINVLRVIAAYDGTEVSFDPPVPAAAPPALDAGAFVEVEITAATRVSSTAPVLVAQYMAGARRNLRRESPALVIVPPLEQHELATTFVVPPEQIERPSGVTYAQSYVALTRRTGATVTLDGADLEATWAPLGDGLEWHVEPVEGGAHRVESTQPLGVIVYGNGDGGTAFAYPGGMSLNPIPLR